MRPVMQSNLRPPTESGPPGNCFAACIASLLEVDLSEVPSPVESDRLPGGWSAPGGYWDRLGGWLASRGWQLVEFDRDRGMVESSTICSTRLENFVVLTGLSPRGDWLHSVVGQSAVVDGERLSHFVVAHDPHPEGTGIEPEGLTKISYLAPIDPAPFEASRRQVDRLASALLGEFPEWGPGDEGAVDMALRILRRQRKAIAAALAALELFREEVAEPGPRECSCCISPPCFDCTENQGKREAFAMAREAEAFANSTRGGE